MAALSPSVEKLWKDWDLRLLVLLSLSLQIVLIFLGNRRKYVRKLWIKIIVWSAYLAADSVATFALGVISNNLRGMYCGQDAGGTNLVANDAELTAFWAPFLVLHLGGPDTITAYALEDNELWLRHLLGLITQTGIAAYVVLMAWTGSYLSFLSMLILLAGFIKYGERTWALWSASIGKLRERTVPTQPSLHGEDDLFSRDYGINGQEGYAVGVDKISEVQLPVNMNSPFDEVKLLTSERFLNVTKRLFLDSILGSNDIDATHMVFRSMSFGKAFQIIEIQLGFMYDLFYTKSPLLYTPWGLCLRFITFFLTCSALLLFIFLNPKHNYSNIDLSISFTLLVVALILEIYSALVLLSSDGFSIWLGNHSKKTSNFQPLISFPRIIFKSPSPSPRWSNKMPQFSLLSFCIGEKPLPCRNILKLLSMNEKLEKQWYVNDKEVPENLKKLIFEFVQIKALKDGTPFAAVDIANPRSLYRDDEADPRIKETLGQFILMLHIGTELLYYRYKEDIRTTCSSTLRGHFKMIKQISCYMMYLLINYPSMLSADQISENVFRETVSHVKKVLGKAEGLSKTEACKKLVNSELDSDNQDEETSDPSAMSILHLAVSDFTEDLRTPKTEEKLLDMWENFSLQWLETLTHAAGTCKGNHHAQQLRRGGELLTHVWLLEAHFGLTHHFQILEPPRIGRLIRK